jgi:hypothetical protein
MQLSLGCYLIEPAANFISLLSKPISSYRSFKNNNFNLYGKWIQYFTELYNSKDEFLLMANTNIMNTKNKNPILENNFIKNYKIMKDNFCQLSQSNILTGDLDITLNSNKSFVDNDCQLLKYINIETKNQKNLDNAIFTMVVCVFQYLNEFEDKSINSNLWNYCLRSSKFSKKCFITGILILLCQYAWITALIYNTYEEFEMSRNSIVVIITITSTLVSLFYSYNSINSYNNSRKLYNFLINLYTDYPSIILDQDEKKSSNFKNRDITIKKRHIYYNWSADFLSNCILPIIIPIINIFIILNSESVVDAILNCMAIFFIIHIDEELYSFSNYKNEKLSIDFTKWIMANIYCSYFIEFKDTFRNEVDNWENNLNEINNRFKANRVTPQEVFIY